MTTSFRAAEIDALIGRRPRAELRAVDRAAFRGRRIMVTGAAGSIGSALAHALAGARPATLALVDHSEAGLFTIERAIRRAAPDVPVDAWLLDASQTPAIGKACRLSRPDVVYHAAACKHVNMAERAPATALGANVLGAVATATAAAAVGARFVLISSDKAADPRGVMGATKRLAEHLVLGMASPAFRPIVVRFGNVLASSGSVLPLMRDAIRAGRPIRLTDRDATRFFMTIGEAVALVVRADLIGREPRVFWLDMGDPIRMGDLVDRLLHLEASLGFPPVPVEIIGLQPGEKRTETLADRDLVLDRTSDEGILVARELPGARLARAAILARVRRAVGQADDRAALDVLRAAVPGFLPSDLAVACAGRAPSAESNAPPRQRRPAA